MVVVVVINNMATGVIIHPGLTIFKLYKPPPPHPTILLVYTFYLCDTNVDHNSFIIVSI